MNMSEDGIHFTLGRAEALVLFEMLADFHSESCLNINGSAERLALVRLEAALEKVLVEPLMPDYKALIDEARLSLSAQYGVV